jgi:DNA primase
MMQLDYTAIRAQIPIRRVLDLLEWKPAIRRGAQWRGDCPLGCSASPSAPQNPCFSVHVSRHLFQCFYCHCRGNQLDLWEAVTGHPLRLATLDLCRRLGIQPTTLPNPQPRNPP